ncbi:MAG: hypothetical protein EXR94_01250 [Gemmatimonadetes bacterium]|nr:hypothetical protein [Gemmatimonadota bacterium]
MTKSAQSLFFFALYLFGLGAILLVAPNWLLGLFDIPPTTEVWIRIVGMLVLFLGVYYVSAARANFLPMLEASVRVRVAVPLFFGAFVALGWAPSSLLLFGGVDLAGAVWTYLTLRSELGSDAPNGKPA